MLLFLAREMHIPLASKLKFNEMATSILIYEFSDYTETKKIFEWPKVYEQNSLVAARIFRFGSRNLVDIFTLDFDT